MNATQAESNRPTISEHNSLQEASRLQTLRRAILPHEFLEEIDGCSGAGGLAVLDKRCDLAVAIADTNELALLLAVVAQKFLVRAGLRQRAKPPAVDTMKYELAHGRRPRGYGNWAFCPSRVYSRRNYLDYCVRFCGTFGEARKQARELMRGLCDDLTTCS